VAAEKGHPGEPLYFHQVLSHSQSPTEQEALFQSIRPAIIGGIEGQSSTIVAYGGPQSGKTYALSGFFTHSQLHGLAPRAINLIVESIEKNPTNAPVIEASFFELGQDAVYDLVPPSLPKVGMQELSRAPFVKMDEKLTSIRCDGQAGFNRLLDTYFTGLEHRRKGTHTCFQITFVHEDRSGSSRLAVRSYLRFVEMAWPRSLTSVSAPSGSHTSLVAGGAGKPKASTLAQDRTVASLDQVLQCKLSGSGTPPYRCSPLVLLMKPCFEGASLLTFVYCMRLEHSHLCSLALAAPLLSKLHTWLSRTSGVREEAQNGIVARMGPNGAPIVPPLQLQSNQVAVAQRQPAVGDLSTEMSSCGTSEESGSPEHDSSVAISRTADADAGAGVHEIEQLAMEPAIDVEKMLRDCALLLEVKQRSTQMLQADAERSAVVLENLSGVLSRLRVKREASADPRPCEKETNLRLLFEKVSRSLQRNKVEIAKMYEDIEIIAQFCQGGAVPSAYDSYNVTENDVQKMVDHMMSDVGPSLAAAAEVRPAGDRPPPAPAENVVIIPQLPLSLLSQEAVDIPQQNLQAGGSNILSPSSASSCSDLDVSQNPMPQKGPSGYVEMGRSPGLVTRSLVAPGYTMNQNMALPHTPPVPSRMMLGMAQPTMFGLTHSQQNLGGSIFVPPGRDDLDVSQHGSSILVPADLQPTASYGGNYQEAKAHYPSVHVQVTAPESDLDRLRKSHSTTAIRSLSSAAMNTVALSSGAASNGPPPVVRAPVASPLVGHRSTLSSVSPLRGAFQGQSAAAPSISQSASMSALPGTGGHASPMVVPKRSIMQNVAGARGPQRPAAMMPPHVPGSSIDVQASHASLVARQSTPVPQPTKGQGARGTGGAQAHSPSPVMMRRSVSTQALRFDRPTAAGVKTQAHEKALPRGQAAPGGPSPERQRPAAHMGSAAASAVPVRAMSPAARSAQR
jgi:hypothetical protein